MRWLLAITVLVLCGCSRQPDLMPLKVGHSATYEVTFGLEKHVSDLRVTQEVPVAGVAGYQIEGAGGVSRLAWKQSELLASQTANAFFDPPIPIAYVGGKDRQWSGFIESKGVRSPATATIAQKPDKLDLGAKTIDATLSTVLIKLPKGTIQLDSWFEPGVGLVRQEQRTGYQLVVRMEMLGGPKD